MLITDNQLANTSLVRVDDFMRIWIGNYVFTDKNRDTATERARRATEAVNSSQKRGPRPGWNHYVS